DQIVPPCIATFSLHDALPIFVVDRSIVANVFGGPQKAHVAAEAGEILAQLRADAVGRDLVVVERAVSDGMPKLRHQLPASGGGRSEEHTSELQSRFDIVCRLL